MRKILLFMIFSLLCVYSHSQDIQSFSGPTTVVGGSGIQYSGFFKKALEKDTVLIFNCTYGRLDTPSGSTEVRKTIGKGSTNFTITVYWNNVDVNGALIKVCTASQPGLVKEVVVTIKKTSGSTGGTGYISGPIILYSEQTGTFNFQPENSKNRIYWEFDTNILTKVNTSDKYPKTLLLKAQNFSGIKTAKITAFEGKEGVNQFRKSEYKVSVIGLPIITPNKKLACSGESIQYNLSLLEYYPGATITWQAGINTTLVSGQGTKTATFKASGNGNANVKAIIKYNNINYTVENSDVWAGPPPRYGAQPNSTMPPCGINTKNFAKTVANYPTEALNETTLTWKANVKIVADNKLECITGPGISGTTLRISVNATNRCGTTVGGQGKATYIGTCNPGKPPTKLRNDEAISSGIINSSAPVSVKIHSFSTGEVVYQNKKAINFNINDTNLKKGIYIVTITDNKGNITQDKIMKTTD